MIFLITPVYKQMEDTDNFVESITGAIFEKYHLVIVDDSPDNRYSDYAKRDNIVVVKGNGNLYWGGAINVGLDYIKNRCQFGDTDVVIFANNDITIEKKSVDIVLGYLRKNPNSLFHPRIFNEHKLEISAGSRVKSWFPYITVHPKEFSEQVTRIDLVGARFLCMSGKVLRRLEGINNKLPHYAGDNDFSLRAKELGYKTYLVRDAYCKVNDRRVGMKNQDIECLSRLFRSFFSIKSPNCIRYRYYFISSHFGVIASVLIVLSMTVNTIAKYSIKKILLK